MSNIINTPINLELKENKIEFDESNLLTTLMEANTYKVKIHTNEILDKCKLVMKRYGDKKKEDDNDLIEADSELRPEVIKLIKISKIYNPTIGDSEEVNYWGVIRLFNDSGTEKTEDDIYMADIYNYAINRVDNEVPGLQKDQMVYLNKIGELTANIYFDKGGSSESINEGEYKFNLVNFIYEKNNSSIDFSKNSITKEEKDGKIIYKDNETEIIVYEEYYDTSLIPEPPEIDNELIIPNSIKFSSTVILDTENNETFNLNFENFEIPFSIYNEEEKKYYFKQSLDFNGIPEIIKTENGEEGETETGKGKKVVKINENLTIDNVTFKYSELNASTPNETENYSKVSGVLNITLKFSKEDFSNYEFEVGGNIDFTIEKEIPFTNNEGKILYKIPVLTLVSEEIKGIQIDGTGDPEQIDITEEPVYETYSTLDENGETIEEFVLDENGLKIPKFVKENKLLLDDENNAIRQEGGNSINKPKPKYERDPFGDIVYEYFLIPIYKRGEDGKLILENNKPQYVYIDEENTKIKYEQDYKGDYIYDKRPKPVYEVDENGNKIIIDGEYLIQYEYDTEGNPIIDQEGKNYLYETYLTLDDNGETIEKFVLDENDLKIPIYQRGISFVYDENGNAIQETKSCEKKINKILYQVDENNNQINEQFLIPKYKRNDDGSLVLDDNNKPQYSGDGKIEYEKHPNGSYIYLIKPLPYYVLDGNGERIITEDHEYEVEYVLNGTGQPIRDENGELILDSNSKKILVNGEIKDLEEGQRGYYEIISSKQSNGEGLEEGSEEYVYEEFVAYLSNYLPKYEVISINEKEYYVVKESTGNDSKGLEQNKETYVVEEVPTKAISDTSDNYLILTPETDEEGNIVYKTDSEGEKEIIEGSQELITLGDGQENVEIQYSTTNNMVIFYDGFTYSKKPTDKTEFVEEVEENHIYTGTIGSDDLPLYTEKIIIGLKKEDSSNNIEYITNGVELDVERSIQTFSWESDETYANQKYIFSYYDEEVNGFYEGDSENPIYLSGRENYIYIDKTDSSNILIYKWNPEIGFYKLNPVTNKTIK
jgi:hypothetical protein